ncbi:MAG: hypothetical protein ACYSX0_11965 [Planctomycetota bacterium]|jgi:hypothetical protein
MILFLAPPLPALFFALWGLRGGESRRLAITALVLAWAESLFHGFLFWNSALR